MGDEISMAKLGQFVRVQGGYAYKSEDFASSGIPVLKIKNIRFRYVDISETDFVAPHIADLTDKFYANYGDILMSMTGSGLHAPDSMVGRVARYTGPQKKYLINQRVGRLVITSPDDLDDRFLFLLLTYPRYQQELVSIATGSANQVNISGEQIEFLIIPWFPLPEQRAIAHILGTLDDKIELNHKMNETLEAMAQALFKNWFVDFEPFRDQGMEDSPLGPIPRGWRTKPLDQVAQFLNGLALQKYPPDNHGYLPVIKIAELRRGITNASDKASLNIPTEYIINDGDVLFSWSGSLDVVIWCNGTGALNQHLFKVTSTDYPQWFFYFWIKYHLPEFQAIAASKATTMGHIQRYHLTAALVSVPPPGLLQRMDKVMSPIWDRLITNKLESRTIATLRDTLLPKLLSGEIRVKDAERFAERAT